MNQDARGRATLLAWWLAPSLLCLLLHWHGFLAWFRADDFAWLGLAPNVHSFHDLLAALFQPRAQGTIRPWSERVFFIAGYSLFGLHSLPYRIVIFATQFAALGLVAGIARRLTGSAAAGFCAAILWCVNSSLMEPLGWACVYNEVLSAFFLLLAFHLLLRFIDSGDRRLELWQWIVFLLGFGALELNVVYPAIAAGYTFLCARHYFRRTLPLFGVSALYVVVHNLAAPVPKTGAYAMHFTASMLRTLAILWTWSVGPTNLSTPFAVSRRLVLIGVTLITLGLLLFLARRWRSGVAPFFLLWYLVTVAPMLPLRDHVTEYYVYVPAIGICWLGGWALVQAWRAGFLPRIAAAAVALLYGFLQIPHLMAATEWNYRLTVRAHNFIDDVSEARREHPRQTILLSGMDADLYWNTVGDHPFPLLGIDHVYLAPDPGRYQESLPEWEGVSEFILPPAVVNHELALRELVVYDTTGSHLRDITSEFAAAPRSEELPSRIDAGDPLTAHLLGPEWYSVDENHRWMPKTATILIAGPRAAGQSLHLHGNCSDEQLHAGALIVTVTVDGSTLPVASIHPGESSFDLDFPLPERFIGKARLPLTIHVSRTFRPQGDSRELGLAFGIIEIR